MTFKKIVAAILGVGVVASGCQLPMGLARDATRGVAITVNLSDPGLRSSSGRLLLGNADSVTLNVFLNNSRVDGKTVPLAGKKTSTVTFQLEALKTYSVEATARSSSGVLLFAGSTTVDLVNNVVGTLNLLPVDAQGKLSTWPTVTPEVASQPAGQGVIQALTLAKGASTTFLIDFQSLSTAFTFTEPPSGLEIYAQNTDTGEALTIAANRTITKTLAGTKFWVTYYAPSASSSLTSLGRFSIPLQSVRPTGTLSVVVGSTLTPGYTASPPNADGQSATDFSWSSNDLSVATVDKTKGTVTGVKVGKTKIVMTSIASPTISATFDLQVNAVAVTGVTLNPTTKTLAPGATFTLTADVGPATATDKAISWGSSNTKVATVAGGIITAVAPGTATITVTTNDGAKTATCIVTVTGDASFSFGIGSPTDLAFSEASITILQGETLEISSSNSDLTNNGTGWKWTVGNSAVQATKTGSNFTLDVSGYGPGQYYLDLLVTLGSTTYSGTIAFIVEAH